jgi:two-component system, OmpR family, sensor histidine kinase KdpD
VTHELNAQTRDGLRSQAVAWLRIYLGYAPGVGKTYTMLHEGRRRKARGTDVVVGWVETYSRPHTIDAVGDLEIVPPRVISHQGVAVEEMDVDAIIDRRPQVVLVDELAHSNVRGSKHPKRYQDVLDLRASGINVIASVNIQHLASLHETVRMLTGVTVTETLPDWVLDAADELEMVDQTPEALRKRLRHGNVQPKEQVQRALDGFFRVEHLTALRELALRRMGQHIESRLRSGVGSPEPSSETVLVCVPSNDLAQPLVRRGVLLAQRLHARLVVLHVAPAGRTLPSDGSTGYQETVRALQLARALGAEVITEPAANIAQTLARYASEMNVTQIVMGESTRSWPRELFQGSVLRDVLKRIKDVDVYIVRRGGLVSAAPSRGS